MINFKFKNRFALQGGFKFFKKGKTELYLTLFFVILSAKHERIRNPLKRETDCREPFGARNDEGGVENGLPRA